MKEHKCIRKYYPLKEAIELAAVQNLQRDIRLDLEEDESALDIYREEAKYLLKTAGENYLPEFPDTEHICVSKL